MNKKILFSGFLVCFLSLLFALSAIRFSNLNFPQEFSGRLVFANTVEKGLQLNKMVLKTPENAVTLELDNNYWRVKEADYYYGNIEFLNNLFIAINNSHFYRPQIYSPEALLRDGLDADVGVTVETYADDVLLDSIVIGRALNNNLYYFAKPSAKDEIWLIDGNFELPHELYSWLQQPLTMYPNDTIEALSIKTDDFQNYAERESKLMPFFDMDNNIVNPSALLERFNYLTFDKVLSVQNFSETSMPNHREIKLTTFDGLITTFDLFYDHKNCWVKISFSTTSLPTAAVNAYIKDNAFLYEDWYFRLPNSTGRVLGNFILR